MANEKEVLNLIDILMAKAPKNFSLKASIKKRRNKSNAVWRINISRTSLPRLKQLVLPYIITEMQYKLGITNKIFKIKSFGKGQRQYLH